jgi:predicted SAM-dependent methyltransferase
MHPKNFLKEVHRVLKPGGKLLISTPNVATLANRFALFFLGRFPPDRSLHDGKAYGHVHFWDKKYLLDVLNSNGFSITKSWNKFLQISSNRYVTNSILEKLFKNFCEQNIYLCNKVNMSK